jgi:methanogenic corrinoid protein MtbC1
MSSANRLQAPRSANDECKDSLQKVVEEQLIPRLLSSQNYSARLSAQDISDSNPEPFPEFNEFTQACREGDSLKVNKIVDALVDQGVVHERIFLELITPAARHLGALWDKDLCSFTEVTCGLALMHQVTYRLGYEFRDGPQAEGLQAHVMLCCAPGSMHFLGATIVADLFRREGATVVIEISSTEQELVRAAANEWFDVIGISVALEAQLLKLPELIARLKKSSGNPHAKVLLGGPIFLLIDAQPEMFGADAISNNPTEVVALLKRFASK